MESAMQDIFNKIFVCIEQIMITLIEENRYSFQLIQSTKQLSTEMNVSAEKLDYSIDSLQLVDNYLNNLTGREHLDIDVYLSTTIYFSQVLILLCNGTWSIEKYQRYLPPDKDAFYEGDEQIWIYSLNLEIYPTGFTLHPYYIVMKNIVGDKIDLVQEVTSSISVFENHQIEDGFLSRYEFSGLGTLMDEGFDFYSEIPILISKLANSLNIPEKKLNKSVSSLKLISDGIHSCGEKFLCDQEYFDEMSFLALAVYIGEVIIKAVDGKWRINNIQKIHRGEIRRYYWTLRLFNSKDRELESFLFDITNRLMEYSYKGSRIDCLVKFYIQADREQDETTWEDTTPYLETRVWKKVLEHIY